MKIVTICDGGVVRSVGLAKLLRGGLVSGKDHDAIPLSGRTSSPHTIATFGEWADRIIVMQPRMVKQYVPQYLHKKTIVCDVGPDVYHRPGHPELVRLCTNFINREGL